MKFKYLRLIRLVLNHYSCFLLTGILISSCAQIGAPSGGATDKNPPKVLRYRPDSATVNFNSRSIELTFNEFVQLQELSSQLIISPPLEYSPVITIKKKTLVIEFNKKELLKPNATYSISLGNAVKDIREGNAVENFRYIFSTGNFIDSLTVNGTVQQAFDHKMEKNILVMLYQDQDDSAVYKRLPDYFAKTNEFGAFQINNIKQGTYRLIALKDGNSNYKYNDDESIGFIDTLIKAGTTRALSVYIYQEQPKKIFLKKYNQIQYGKFVLIFNKGTDSLRISQLNKEKLGGTKELIEFSKNKDTLTYWLDHVDKDSLILQVNNGNTILDTIAFKLIKKENALKQNNRFPLKLYVSRSTMNGGSFDLNNDLSLHFSHPVVSVNESAAISVKEDTLNYTSYPLVFTKPTAPASIINIVTPTKINAKNSSRNMLVKENTRYHLMIPPATFTDFFGLTNDTIKMDFKTKEEKYYGSVKLNIKFAANRGNYIVQLLDDKETIVRETHLSQAESIFYDYLYPQAYKLKLILDRNGNGKWDEGDYLKKLQPEKVIYNIEPVTIRSNWDLDLEWSITEPK